MSTITAAKKIHRFLLPDLPPVTIGEVITITDERVRHQIHRVLKLQPGEKIIVFVDGGKNITTEINSTSAKSLNVTIIDSTDSASVPRPVIAAISITKGDTFELIVQKLTEIGIQTIVPLITGRTIKQSVRRERLQTISDEALEQCGGTHRVHISEPLSLTECFTAYPYHSVILDPLATTTTIETSSEPIVFYVGPEGGWNEQDEAIMTSFNPTYLQITQRVLRTETAAILAGYTLLWHINTK